MFKWLLLTVLLASPIAYACDHSLPTCAVESYVQAHIEKDVEAVFELTAASEKGDFEEFAVWYHETHVMNQEFQSYWEETTSVNSEILQQSDNFARVLVNTQYPDWSNLAFERAMEGHGLDTNSDWEQLVAELRQKDVTLIEKSTEFYLVPGDGGWKVLRPSLR